MLGNVIKPSHLIFQVQHDAASQSVQKFKSLQIPMEHEKLAKIGEGSMGLYYKCRNKTSGQVAIAKSLWNLKMILSLLRK